MGLVKIVTNSFFYGLIFLILIFVGEWIFPNSLLKPSFSNLGIIIIVLAVGLDAFFNQVTVDL